MKGIVIAYKKRDGASDKTQPGNVLASGFFSVNGAHGSLRKVAQKHSIQPDDLGVFKDGKHVPHLDRVVPQGIPTGVPATA